MLRGPLIWTLKTASSAVAPELPMAAVRSLLPLLAALLCTVGAISLPPATAHAQDTWQFHLAQANTFYRNRLLPRAMSELKIVVADPEGAKKLKPWQLLVDVADTLKDLETLIWALENGRELAEGQEAGQMQAQLYRLKRVYGRVVFEATGGSGKLPKKGIKLKAAEEPEDPNIKAYFEKARAGFQSDGYAIGQAWLPAGQYELDGEPLTITAGKDISIEVAPTTEITFAINVAGSAGGRFGDQTTGAGGFLGGLDIGFGPHIQFASGNSLVIQVGPVGLFGAQATTDVAQNLYSNDQRARLSVGGVAMVAFEFRIATVDVSPRIGYGVHWLPSGMYYKGTVVSAPEGGPTGVLEGEFIVPGLAHGPRLGLNVLLTPALIKGKRRPRLFVGAVGGPLWMQPLWGDADSGAGVEGVSAETSGGQTAADLGGGPFAIKDILAGDGRATSKAYADIQGIIGIQARF